MITVPEEIKDKLHLDHCQKNIRIHFPNGERSDICNDLIVKDTVNFTESLCSQDQLKFGLCEAPVFECEVVGVGNIKGALIEVSCEIFCDQTVSGSEWKTDLQHYVYSVPYGTFTISDCKRQADMIHRKITAYGGSAAYDWNLSESELMYEQFEFGSAFSITQYPLEYMAINIGLAQFNPDMWEAGGKTYVRTQFSQTISGVFYTYTLSGYYYDLQVDGVVASVKPDANNSANRKDLFEWATNAEPNESTRKTCINSLMELCNPQLVYFGNNNDTKKAVCHVPKYPMTFWGQATLLSPYGSPALRFLAYNPTLTVTSIGTGQSTTYTVERDPISMNESDGNLSVMRLKDDFRKFPLTFTAEKNKNDKFSIVFPTEPTTQAIVSSFSELYGYFGYFDRYGSFRYLLIKQQFGLLPANTLYPGSDVYPEGVTGGKLLPDDYTSCWYDDDYTLPFGLVQCGFTDSNDAQVVFRLYLPGFDEYSDVSSYRVYDLSENETIQRYAWTLSQIQEICETIADNIIGVTYMPVEFVGRGLPYVEAGDTFEILTKSNDSITTIVLNRTLSGEQTLTDTYKSV